MKREAAIKDLLRRAMPECGALGRAPSDRKRSELGIMQVRRDDSLASTGQRQGRRDMHTSPAARSKVTIWPEARARRRSDLAQCAQCAQCGPVLPSASVEPAILASGPTYQCGPGWRSADAGVSRIASRASAPLAPLRHDTYVALAHLVFVFASARFGSHRPRAPTQAGPSAHSTHSTHSTHQIRAIRSTGFRGIEGSASIRAVKRCAEGCGTVRSTSDGGMHELGSWRRPA